VEVEPVGAPQFEVKARTDRHKHSTEQKVSSQLERSVLAPSQPAFANPLWQLGERLATGFSSILATTIQLFVSFPSSFNLPSCSFSCLVVLQRSRLELLLLLLPIGQHTRTPTKVTLTVT